MVDLEFRGKSIYQQLTKRNYRTEGDAAELTEDEAARGAVSLTRKERACILSFFR